MAEAASLVVQEVLKEMTSMLIAEARLLGSAQSEIEELRNDLETMKSFLLDAEQKSESDEGIRTWVKQVRAAAYDIEDVLEDFLLRLTPPHKSPPLLRFVHKWYHNIRHVRTRHEIAVRIQGIKRGMKEISERRDSFRFKRIDQLESTHQTWYDPRRGSLFLEEADVVGIENPRNRLVSLLVDGGNEILTAISVVGMGGLGKTTLVKRSYDSRQVKKHFDCHAWITVSKSFSVVELLQAALIGFLKSVKQPVPGAIETMSDSQLVNELKNFLQQKRYILVFDDVWSANVWDAMKFALPDWGRGSRIIFTTRINDVAMSIDIKGHVYHLQPLPHKESWILFCMKAFRGKQRGVCPEELKEISLSILKKCAGLPLAIVTIAGLLSKKNMMVTEWKKIHDSLAAEMKSNSSLENLEKILLLSYKDLPSNLKHCYLYLSVFPEDYLIKRMKLIRLWVAEGLVEAKPGLTMEEVAEDYLNELVSRSMIQVVLKDYFNRVQTCRIHDLMRDIIQMKSRQESFAMILSDRNISLDKKVHRMVIDDSCKNLPSVMRFPKLRSLLVFILPKSSRSFGSTFFHGFRLLRVLELERASISEFPKGLTEMIHLRYLSLRRTQLRQLPESIRKLKSLEILDLKFSFVRSLPHGILELENLCQLRNYIFQSGSSASSEMCGMWVPAGIGRLTNLQKLGSVEAGSNNSIVRELSKLTELKRLGILNLRRDQEMDLCSSVEKLKHLTGLYVTSASRSEPFQLDSLSSPPPYLQRLFLKCNLPTFPRWVASLQFLGKLVLEYSNSNEDPLKTFQTLRNLVVLELREAYKGYKLCCDAGGYPNLKKLSLSNLKQLRSIKVAKGAMTGLKELDIAACHNLEKVPEGIEHLEDVQDLLLVSMPRRFVMRVEGPDGVDFVKVKHIPTVKAFRTLWDMRLNRRNIQQISLT